MHNYSYLWPMKDYEIFISHSTRDSELVTKLVEAIETAGYRCWVSPRDIRAGIPYAHAIMEGLDACKVFVVVLTDNSIKSEHVLNEIDNAQNTGKHIIPLRRRDDGLELPGEFKYYLSRTQHVFIDGTNFTDIIAKMGLAPKQPQAPVEKPQAKEVTVDEIAKKGLAHLDTKNYSLALPLLIEAAERGNIEAMAAVGRIYDEGLGVNRDYNKAQEWYTKAAEAGYTPAFYPLSKLMSTIANNTKEPETKKGYRHQSDIWLQKAADAGDGQAQYRLGDRYFYQGSELAINWYEKAAEGGNVFACLSLGNIYYRGIIGYFEQFQQRVQKDYIKSVGYFISCANAITLPDSAQGLEFAITYGLKGEAYFKIAKIYNEGGYGILADKKMALDYLLSSAKIFYSDAYLELGKTYLYGNGYGCSKNLHEAIKWLKKALEHCGNKEQEEARELLHSNLKLRILAMFK